jgi:hypothetical protein
MLAVAQLVRASECGSEGRRFESGQSTHASVMKLVAHARLKILWTERSVSVRPRPEVP